jgi:hypothetical protein
MFGAVRTHSIPREKEILEAVQAFDPGGRVFKLSGDAPFGTVHCQITGLEELGDDDARWNQMCETMRCLIPACAPEAFKFIVCDAHNKNFSLLGRSS